MGYFSRFKPINCSLLGAWSIYLDNGNLFRRKSGEIDMVAIDEWSIRLVIIWLHVWLLPVLLHDCLSLIKLMCFVC